jgi:hypothetical protein
MFLTTPRMAPAILLQVLSDRVVVFLNGDAPSNWARNLLYGALFRVVLIRDIQAYEHVSSQTLE